jgi:hypothetical protein
MTYPASYPPSSSISMDDYWWFWLVFINL